MAKGSDERQHRGSEKDENRRRRWQLVPNREAPSRCRAASAADDELRRLIRELQERQKSSRSAQRDDLWPPAA